MRLGLPAIETINVDTYETWPKWAKGLSIGHKARLDEPNPAFVLPDLLVHYVRGELISGETFSGQEEHRIFSFHGCTLVNCIFYGPRGVKFDRCRLINCRFEEMSPQKPGWDLSYDKSELLNTPSHKEGMFLFVGLSLSLNIIDCYVSNIWFHNVKLRYLYLRGTFGLPTCHGMQSIEIPPDEVRRSNTQIMDTPVGWFDRYASWEQL
jgi:hypothetical protein